MRIDDAQLAGLAVQIDADAMGGHGDLLVVKWWSGSYQSSHYEVALNKYHRFAGFVPRCARQCAQPLVRHAVCQKRQSPRHPGGFGDPGALVDMPKTCGGCTQMEILKSWEYS